MRASSTWAAASPSVLTMWATLGSPVTVSSSGRVMTASFTPVLSGLDMPRGYRGRGQDGARSPLAVTRLRAVLFTTETPSPCGFTSTSFGRTSVARVAPNSDRVSTTARLPAWGSRTDTEPVSWVDTYTRLVWALTATPQAVDGVSRVSTTDREVPSTTVTALASRLVT